MFIYLRNNEFYSSLFATYECGNWSSFVTVISFQIDKQINMTGHLYAPGSPWRYFKYNPGFMSTHFLREL